MWHFYRKLLPKVRVISSQFNASTFLPELWSGFSIGPSYWAVADMKASEGFIADCHLVAFALGPVISLRVNSCIRTDPSNSLDHNISDAKSLTSKLQSVTFLMSVSCLISMPSILIKSSRTWKTCIQKDRRKAFLHYGNPWDLWEDTDAGSASTCLCSGPAMVPCCSWEILIDCAFVCPNM